MGRAKVLVDVTQCPIATEGINDALPYAREELQQMQSRKKGALCCSGHTLEGVITDPKKTASEKVGGLLFQLGEFFQNNPFIFAQNGRARCRAGKGKELRIACRRILWRGLFSLSAAAYFDRVVGIEISREGSNGHHGRTPC